MEVFETDMETLLNGLFVTCMHHASYFQNAEEVDFSGNGITAVGLKAFDGILQANAVLKTLNLSGNAIGDEGAKVISSSNFTTYHY